MKLYNPWRIIRELRARVAYLEGRLDEVTDRAEDAEARAFDRASRYWQFQVERSREQEKAAITQLMQVESLRPRPPFFVDPTILEKDAKSPQ